ncbi:hypothetical protein K438DRAFT_1983857 [Mycena galopus ATCC 62051]|nr:hypothetical protein K438DRAFT_1983857 [Mycena galopus ATCC 62051]
MFAKAFLLAATLIFAAGARAQACDNGGIAVGVTQLCNFSGKNIGEQQFTHLRRNPGLDHVTQVPSDFWSLIDSLTFTAFLHFQPAAILDVVVTKDNLNILPGDLCGDYAGIYGNAAWTTCNGSTVVSVDPPNAGIVYCESFSPPEIGIFFSRRCLLLLLLDWTVSDKLRKTHGTRG